MSNICILCKIQKEFGQNNKYIDCVVLPFLNSSYEYIRELNKIYENNDLAITSEKLEKYDNNNNNGTKINLNNSLINTYNEEIEYKVLDSLKISEGEIVLICQNNNSPTKIIIQSDYITNIEEFGDVAGKVIILYEYKKLSNAHLLTLVALSYSIQISSASKSGNDKINEKECVDEFKIIKTDTTNTINSDTNEIPVNDQTNLIPNKLAKLYDSFVKDSETNSNNSNSNDKCNLASNNKAITLESFFFNSSTNNIHEYETINDNNVNDSEINNLLRLNGKLSSFGHINNKRIKRGETMEKKNKKESYNLEHCKTPPNYYDIKF